MAKLYLIPNEISEEGLTTVPSYVKDIVRELRFFVVEEERGARRFLKKFVPELPLAECTFQALNEHSLPKDCQEILNKAGSKDIGIVSESGCPCVADPGRDLVALGHAQGFEILPLVGPSSILLALMASGLNGQNFAFNGYLPKEKDERVKRIKFLEKRSLAEGQTQIFMDTPYRNSHVFEDILSCCEPRTLLCLAIDLNGKEQFVKTLTVSEWKKQNFSIYKKPALFLIQAGSK